MPLGSDAAGGFGALGMIGMPLMIAAMILALFWSCRVQESTKLLSTLSLSNGAAQR